MVSFVEMGFAERFTDAKTEVSRVQSVHWFLGWPIGSEVIFIDASGWMRRAMTA